MLTYDIVSFEQPGREVYETNSKYKNTDIAI